MRSCTIPRDSIGTAQHLTHPWGPICLRMGPAMESLLSGRLLKLARQRCSRQQSHVGGEEGIRGGGNPRAAGCPVFVKVSPPIRLPEGMCTYATCIRLFAF